MEEEQQPYDVPKVTKTYLVTDKLETQLPSEFVNSDNKRYIEVQNVKFYDCNKGNIPDNVFMHVNFIYDKPYLNGCVGPVNHIATKYKLYPFRSNDDTLQLRFSKMENSAIDTISDPTVNYIKFDRTREWNPMESEIVQEFRIICGLFSTTFTRELDMLYQSHDETETENTLISINNMFTKLNTNYVNYFKNPSNKAMLEHYEQYFDDTFKARWKYHLFLKILLWYDTLVSYDYNKYEVCMFPFKLFDYLPQAFDACKDIYNDDDCPYAVLSMFLPYLYFGDISEVTKEFMEALIVQLAFANLLPKVTPRHKEAAIIFMNMLHWKNQRFSLAQNDVETLEKVGMLYINYGQYVPEEHQDKVYNMLCSIETNTFDYDMACYCCQFNEDDYKTYGVQLSDELMFYHCCQILSGKKQQEPVYHTTEVRSGQIKQIANDSLSNCTFERVIKYKRSYIKKQSPTVAKVDNIIQMQYPVERNRFNVFCDIAKDLFTPTLFTQFNDNEGVNEEFKLSYNLKRNEFRSKVQDAIDNHSNNEIFRNYVGPQLLELTANDIDSDKLCVYTFLDSLLSIIEPNIDELILQTPDYWRWIISKLNNVWNIKTEEGVLYTIDYFYYNGRFDKYYYGEPNDDTESFYSIIGLIFGYQKRQVIDAYMNEIKYLCGVDEYITFVYRMYEYFISYEGEINANIYSFYRNYYGIISNYHGDMKTLFEIAYECYKQTPLASIISKFAVLQGFKPNISKGDDVFSYSYVLYLEMLNFMAGAEVDELDFQLVGITVKDDVEVEHYETNHQLLGVEYKLSYNKTLDLDDIPNEQTEFDENGKEKYNYRFLAEFMLVY